MLIYDDGNGFDYNQILNNLNEGAGIKNMQKRTSLIGGRFSLESPIARGTCIFIQIPGQENLKEVGVG